ncbi:protein phosphatase 2C domain containing protein [Theileria equi strain WA]|uniref:Protein phosphatase 2C domain containing protein n=1 Tax=Theileria equi strain WA TaxID=1537102 RepID=L1LDX2_THEEQ|nr:protein phosphatase 2C domain containing protein [Theileria equi strain WA]EKX73479.1 protein phosphatase 2C domain containing protein [Theileria equi strain WA]|eukprot:XP_004832931.1 protein phosphatase 2C domain containing protein [Theileria equi strain WA]
MDKSKEESELEIPTTGNWSVCANEGDDSRWFLHESQKWMYNVDDHAYFHVASGTILRGEEYLEPALDEQEEEEDEEEFALDFSKDLISGTVSRKAPIESKTESEDRFTTCECMSIQYVSNSEALCYYSGVFDGHYGPECSEYTSRHLKNNILSVFRQSVHSKGVKRRKSIKGAEIADTSHECADVEALVNGCIKGFEMTDNNFCRIADRSNIMDGSTACVLLLYGPDPDGSLKIISANVGDSRAILCSLGDDGESYIATALTVDHKPDSPSEKERILASGGTVEFLQGTWRAVGKLRNQIACALATSRSIGDLMLKTPKKIVSAVPDVRIRTVDFDKDLFVVLCTDGVTDVVTNQEIVNIVAECIQAGNSPEKAAEKIVATSEQRGSYDDKTCTIIYFGWHKEIFSKCLVQDTEVPEDGQKEEENEEEDENIFAA